MMDEHRPKHVANNTVHKYRKFSYNPVVYRDGTCVYLSLAIVCVTASGSWTLTAVRCRVARISFECRLYALDAVLGRLLVKIKSSCSFVTMQRLSCARYNGTCVSVH
jgi:hypothetical protein